MFTILDNKFRPWPMAAGAGVSCLILAALILLPTLMPRSLAPKPTAIPLVIQYVYKQDRKAMRATASKRDAAVRNGALESKPKFGAVTARPGTPAWQAHVAHGRTLALDIYAERSLPVLQAFGITLALDVRRPRGTTNLYDLATRTYARGPVSEGVVVRELENMPPLPGFDEARRIAERELGCETRVFALYPSELYLALRSLTEEALREAKVPLEAVRMAHVQLQSIGGKNFTVTLIDHS